MNKNDPVYILIIAEFFSISHAARKLGFTRKAIYDFIKVGKITDDAKARITAAGYDPKTFKPVNH